MKENVSTNDLFIWDMRRREIRVGFALGLEAPVTSQCLHLSFSDTHKIPVEIIEYVFNVYIYVYEFIK